MARLAASALPGTSAGGEQPKFLTTVRDGHGNFHPVLVKFSPPMDQAAGQRWADLLLCEFHAHEVLAEIGLATSGARVIDAAGRRFLEVPRFDRVGAGGRRGVVSLESLHAAAVGGRGRRNWPTAALELQQEGLVDAEAVATVRRLHAFGELIGNTDMHFGNLSFWLEDTLPFHVAPAYDMLPMLWAPGLQGEIVNRTFSPAPPLPAAQAQWREAMEWAAVFWERVAANARLSADFLNFATEARATLRRLNA
jgi:serine/threonine protein kinase HipA of HipAB toxin-antitoxin module